MRSTQRAITGLKPMSEKLSSPDKLPVLKQITRSHSDTELKKQLDVSASQQQPYSIVMTRPRLKVNESMRGGEKSASEPGAVREKKLTLPPIDKKPSIVVEPPCKVFSKPTFNDQSSHTLPVVKNLYQFFTDGTDKTTLEKIKTEKFANVFF